MTAMAKRGTVVSFMAITLQCVRIRGGAGATENAGAAAEF